MTPTGPTNDPYSARPRRRRIEPQPPPIAEDYEPEYEAPVRYVQEEPSLLRNPYVLAGMAVAVSVVMAVVVVVFFGGNSEGSTIDEVQSNSSAPAGAGVTQTPGISGRGIMARTIAAATVREGPSLDYLEIAPLRSGQDIEVIGRNEQGSWFQIYYPLGSQLKGWVPNSALRLPDGSSERLAVTVATPIPRPTVAIPTETPEPEATAVPTSVATSPTPQTAGPDLAIAIASCQAGTGLVVTVSNAGQVPVAGRQVRISIASQNGPLGAVDSIVSLAPGTAANIATNVPVQSPRLAVRMDLIGAPPDVNAGNNATECTATGIQQSPNQVPSIATQPGLR